MNAPFRVEGSKAPLKGNPNGGGLESPNTLRSDVIAHTTELLGEGECVGWCLADGTPCNSSNYQTAIFFDYTPVLNNDLVTYNYKLVVGQQSVGLPDQPAILGSTQTQTPIDVSTQVKQANPIIKTVSDANVTSVNVVMRIPALSFLNVETGDLTPTTVSYKISVRPAGGFFSDVAQIDIINQKCTSAYQKSTNIVLPVGGFPWDIKVTRETLDSTNVNLQNDTWWDTLFENVQGNFIYPNKFIIDIQVDALYFGQSMPARAFRVKGLKTNIPSNYDPIARTYSGIWDGTFVKSWHNNPAWVFYDLLVNNRYGLGEFIDATIVDKWGLYAIAQYCDALVPSGFKDHLGADIMEPRFSFNGVINNRTEAYKVLQMVASAFRGLAFWALGQVFATADMPTDPVMSFSPANVIKGRFNYSGTAIKARHSVAAVTWSDPQDFFRPAVELIQNDDMLFNFGWRQTDVVAVGCTSRGQANRFGRWILDSEQNETETVTFDISWDGYVLDGGKTLQPGNIILVADPRKTGSVRLGGRLAGINSTSQVILDAPFDPAIGQTYKLTVVMPNGTIETQPITSFDGTKTIATLTTPLSALPQLGTNWVIQGTDVTPRRYRVLAVKETDTNVFNITALFNDPTKYARIDLGVTLDQITYIRPKNQIDPPTNVSAVENLFFQGGVAHSRVTLGWTPGVDFLTAQFGITADSPKGFVDFGKTGQVSIDISDAAPGAWRFYVVAISNTNLQSPATVFDFTVNGWEAVDGPTVGSLALLSGTGIGGLNFSGTAPTITWLNVFPPNTVTYTPENFVRVYDGISNTLLRTETITGLTYTYSYEDNLNDGGPRRTLRFDVTATNQTGAETTPASITVTNPVPAAITPTLTTSTNNLGVSYVSTDADFVGAKIWASLTHGFDPNSVTPSYIGPDTHVSLFVDHGTWYVRVAGYDKFGQSGLIVGPEVSTQVNDITDVVNQVLPDLTNIEKLTHPDFEDVADQLASVITQIINDRDVSDANTQRTHQLLALQVQSLSAVVAFEQKVRLEADFAEASQRQALQAIVYDNSSGILFEEIVRATADTALASSITSLTTTVGTNTAALSVVETSVNGIEVQFGVLGTIDGVTGGFLFTGVRKLDGSVSFDIEIEGDVIVDGTITAPKLSVLELTAISANFGNATVAGAITSQNGKLVIDFNNNQITIAD